MVRTIIKPNAPRINLSIPNEYVGEELEILVFPVNGSESINDREEKQARRQEAFRRFMQYRGTLPADFDYKKELAEYRNERYGYTNWCKYHFRSSNSTPAIRRQIELCEFIEVAGIQKKQVIDALINEDFDDLEDRLQVECARMVNADYIITRDINDFSASPIPAILPEELLKKMAEQE